MSVVAMRRDSALRAHVRRALNDHMSSLGYTTPRALGISGSTPEIVRRNPGRGRIAFGETVLRSDLALSSCHERLKSFSQRRTRSRSTILFFIGVVETQRKEVECLLEELGIRSALGGGHVQIVPVAAPESAASQTRGTSSRQAAAIVKKTGSGK